MTIVSVDKMWSRTASDAKLTDNKRSFEIRFQEAYQVQCTPDTTEGEVYQADGIPTAGTEFPGWPYIICESAKLQKVSPILWIVTIDYQGESGPGASPLNAPPKIDWDDVESEYEIDEDFDGFPIINTAGDRIPGVKALIADQTVTIRRNMLTFNPYVQARYRRSVNSDTFLGWPAGTAKLMKLSASNVYEEGKGYWEVTAQVQFRYPYNTVPGRAWYARVRNEGFYKFILYNGNKLKVRATDKNFEPTTMPILLDADGYELPLNTESPALTEAYWLEFKLYDSLPYNALGLI